MDGDNARTEKERKKKRNDRRLRTPVCDLRNDDNVAATKRAKCMNDRADEDRRDFEEKDLERCIDERRISLVDQ